MDSLQIRYWYYPNNKHAIVRIKDGKIVEHTPVTLKVATFLENGGMLSNSFHSKPPK